eukprot:TRINITY_DN27576_c0_g1_i1.p1 TRINITY_DN27576_c0_g1~~TRINITY_DN27576_c0_g1_i1.p1  ORF type:complete len:470 (-),score=94.83 TRINITY_DN27576_c0_g1_i1:70-1431(-)
MSCKMWRPSSTAASASTAAAAATAAATSAAAACRGCRGGTAVSAAAVRWVPTMRRVAISVGHDATAAAETFPSARCRGAVGGVAKTRGIGSSEQRRMAGNSVHDDGMSMRQRFIMRNQARCKQVSFYMGHIGYMVGICEYGVTSIVWLRLWAIAGGVLICSWQLMQPKVQSVTAGWNAVYASVNIIQLMIYSAKPAVVLTDEETHLHALMGGERNISKSHIQQLAAAGEFLWLVDGAILDDRGAGEHDRCLYFITVGTCEVSVDGRLVAQLGPGSAVGEVGVIAASNAVAASACTASASEPTNGAVNGNVGASATDSNGVGGDAVGVACGAEPVQEVRVSGAVRSFAVSVGEVRRLLEQDPRMRKSLNSVLHDALVKKLAAMNDVTKARSYRAVLEVACLVDEQAGISEGVAAYRSRNGIDDNLHAQLLDELPQCVHKPFRTQSPRELAVLAE